MGLQKNVASQKWIVFAFDETDNTAKTGDAANITAKVSKDGGAGAPLGDTNPTELESGYYVFDLTQAETNADLLAIIPVSSTANIQVIGVPGAVWTDQITAKLPTNYMMGSSVQTDKDDEIDAIKTAIEHGTYGLSALETLVDEVESLLKDGTYGLSALDTDLGTLLTRLSAARAGYIDNLSAGAAALEATLTTIKQKTAGAFDRDTDSLEALRDTAPMGTAMRGTDNTALAASWTAALATILGNFTAARIGYLDNLSAGAAALEATLTAIKGAGWTDENLTTIDSLIDAIKTITDAIPDSGALTALTAYVDEIESRLTAARAGYLDELAAANIPADIDQIKGDLPVNPAKNVALNNLPFLMVLSSDHVTRATGKTVTCQISKDGGAFANCTNSASEIGSGWYKINLTQAEMNADKIILKFTETDCDQTDLAIFTNPT